MTIAEIEPLVPRVGRRSTSASTTTTSSTNPKVTVHIDDARHFLLTTNEKFDAITSDPLDPWVKGAATLYTREFFELVKQHLNPGGVVTLFVQLYESNTAAVKSEIGTFFKAFPNGVVWGNTQQRPGLRPGADGPGRADQDQRRRDGGEARRARSTRRSRSRSARSGFNSAIELLLDLRRAAVGPGAVAQGRADQSRSQPAPAVSRRPGPESVSERSDLLGDAVVRASFRTNCSPDLRRPLQALARGHSTRARAVDTHADDATNLIDSRRCCSRRSSRCSGRRRDARGGAGRGGRHAAGAADRPGILEAQSRTFRAERLFPVGQPAVERDLASSASFRDLLTRTQAGRRLSRRRAGAELHLHRGAQAEDGVHHRHPPRQPAHAADVQGAVRAVGRSRRLHVAAVHEEAAGGPDGEDRRRPTSCNAYWDVADQRRGRSTRRTCKAIEDMLTKKHGLPLGKEDLDGHRVRLPQLLLVRAAHQLQLVDQRRRRRRQHRRTTPT